ncbi:MAG: hypothetical protein Fur0037_12820 [Planctomycetota bacterium]
MTQDLVHLARTLQLESLESRWAEETRSPKPTGSARYAETIETLCDQDMAGQALAMATEMVEALAERGQPARAAQVAISAIRKNIHSEALARRACELLREGYAEHGWFEALARRSGLSAENAGASAALEFERLRRFTNGFVIYHAAGWGAGLVEEVRSGSEEVVVAFESGRREAFPFDTIVDRFKPLDEEDLRAMKILAPDELARLAEEHPSALIAKVARLYRGAVTSTQLKRELVPQVVPAKSWASFWKRAKAAGAKDPWLRVEGSASRPTFALRRRPVGLADEAREAVSHQDDLGGKIAVLREYLSRGIDPELARQIVDLAEPLVAAAVSDPSTTRAHLLDALLFLDEHGKPVPVEPARVLREVVIGSEGALDPRALDGIETQRSKELAARLLPEALGDLWADQVVHLLPEFPGSIVETMVEEIVARGQGKRILEIWDRVAPYPTRHPILTYLLGKHYAEGVFDGVPGRPQPMAVGRVLLHLARVLNKERKGKPLSGRLLNRLTSLLAGKRNFLSVALEDISRQDLSSYLGIVERGGEDFPQEIADIVLRHIATHHPDLTAKAEKPFWERGDVIFTTRSGLNRIKEEYRVLVEERIPANSTAIGVAASHGDLSENSEWDAAMEEQRNLTARAAEIKHQIDSARLIEDQEIAGDVVSPGTRVDLVEEESGDVRTYTILGPWDSQGDDTINYKAPIAECILGLSVGETARIPDPRGPIEVRVSRIEIAL